jgi:ABC-type lipoprotein export system ATPase subunit
MRSLVVNEFESGRWDDPVEAEGQIVTGGEIILVRFGFTLNGEPFTYEWVWYGVLFTVGIALVSCLGSIILLNRIRYVTGGSLITDRGSDDEEEFDLAHEVAIPFTRVDLTFKAIHYTVKSSITNEQLELLKGIDGVVEAGKMTALMGSSGAGKTTLMDVLAMRKTSGEIEGEICLNGHPQEELSFRRCTGYVEQFDLQTPQLTIRETMMFSAKLRLEETDPAVTEESIDTFVDQTLAMLELTNEQDLQVGSDETGGLSFEQKKRLSIAVELVSNPSILFLDEPTSGLVSWIRIREVVHQPSLH